MAENQRHHLPLFHSHMGHQSDRHARVHRIYEIVYTLVDLTAGILFTVGSVMFFYDSLKTAGTWMFLIGSILFMTRPSVRIAREMHLRSLPVRNNDNSERGHRGAS